MLSDRPELLAACPHHFQTQILLSLTLKADYHNRDVQTIRSETCVTGPTRPRSVTTALISNSPMPGLAHVRDLRPSGHEVRPSFSLMSVRVRTHTMYVDRLSMRRP